MFVGFFKMFPSDVLFKILKQVVGKICDTTCSLPKRAFMDRCLMNGPGSGLSHLGFQQGWQGCGDRVQSCLPRRLGSSKKRFLPDFCGATLKFHTFLDIFGWPGVIGAFSQQVNNQEMRSFAKRWQPWICT